MSNFLKNFPILNQLNEVLSDYNVVVSGVLLLLAGIVPELGLQNGGDISTALIYLSGLFAAGYTLFDVIDLWQSKKNLDK